MTDTKNTEYNIPERKIKLKQTSVQNNKSSKRSVWHSSIPYYIFKSLILKYCSVKGRASRKEFWSFVCFVTLLELFISLYCIHMFDIHPELVDNPHIFNILRGIIILLLPPKFTIVIRRVHDFGKSGWWLFVPTLRIIFFPFVKSDKTENKFGKPE